MHEHFNGDLHPRDEKGCPETGYLRFEGDWNARGQFVKVSSEVKKVEFEITLADYLKTCPERSTPAQPQQDLAKSGAYNPTSTSVTDAQETQESSDAVFDGNKGKKSKPSTHAMLLIGGRRYANHASLATMGYAMNSFPVSESNNLDRAEISRGLLHVVNVAVFYDDYTRRNWKPVIILPLFTTVRSSTLDSPTNSPCHVIISSNIDTDRDQTIICRT